MDDLFFCVFEKYLLEPKKLIFHLKFPRSEKSLKINASMHQSLLLEHSGSMPLDVVANLKVGTQTFHSNPKRDEGNFFCSSYRLAYKEINLKY